MKTLPDVGCLISGENGFDNYYRMVQLAIDLGYPMSDRDIETIAAYLRNEPDADLYWIQDRAEEWLNEFVAAENHFFGWDSGDFVYQPMQWWIDCT